MDLNEREAALFGFHNRVKQGQDFKTQIAASAEQGVDQERAIWPDGF